MKVLITAFDPFGGESVNPAFEAVKLLPEKIAGADIVKQEIPTVFHKSLSVLGETIEREQPDITLLIGQAGGRFDLTVERVAINMDDARITDNEGNQPVDVPVHPDGRNAYFARLPIKKMVSDMRAANIPASISNTAGTFVCNHLMYGLLYLIDKQYPNMKGGFMHVPFLPEQVMDKRNMPYMSLIDIANGLEVAVKAAVETDEDIKETGGTIC